MGRGSGGRRRARSWRLLARRARRASSGGARACAPLGRTVVPDDASAGQPHGGDHRRFPGRSEWYASRDGSYKVARFVETVVRDWVAQQLPSSTPLLFGFHSDVTVDHLTRWHKDRLNDHPLLGPFRRRYERHDPWDPALGAYGIYKVLLYLQDGPSLEVVPGSHEEPTLRADASTVRVLDVRVGDVVVMDQRLTNRNEGTPTRRRPRGCSGRCWVHGVPTGSS